MIGDCAVNGDYEDLPDELNQSKDNSVLAEEGEEDDQQVSLIVIPSHLQLAKSFLNMQGGGGLVNGIKLPNGRIIKKVGQVENCWE